MTDLPTYTAVTFAPVQGFIEKSRKLRDLYGSSFILSYLSQAVCLKAGDRLISPALPNLTQGTPNFILVRGHYPKAEAEAAFNAAWKRLVNHCRGWIEDNLREFKYDWERDWNLWSNHAWEFFWAESSANEQDCQNSESSAIDQACQNLSAAKQARNWTAINWTGASSTLSGADAIAWPGMGRIIKAQARSLKADETEIKAFYAALKQKLEGSFGKIEAVDAIEIKQELLSIPELVKRLITYEQVANGLELKSTEHPLVEVPLSFADLNRYQENRWTGWFKGDGDRMSKHLRGLTEQERHDFSQAIMTWGKEFKKELPERKDCKSIDRERRIIYAGGDDFLGVLYREPPDAQKATPEAIKAYKLLVAAECVNWFQQFPQIWEGHGQVWRETGKLITASVGFVWAAPKVPQRDVLQHCNEAESHAKSAGRDRIALRVLFNNGTYLEWICPWRCLPVLQDYCDPQDGSQDWVQLYKDVAVLEARHAFRGNQTEVAIGLLRVYFCQRDRSTSGSFWDGQAQNEFYQLFKVEQGQSPDFDQPGWWNLYSGDDQYNPKGEPISTGILGDRSAFLKNKKQDSAQELDLERIQRAVNAWIINLAKVGFHLCSNT